MRTAIVTGGTKGIGLAVARALADRGYAVYAAYASDEEAAKRALAFGITPIKADVSKEEDVKRLFSLLPRVDVLINNAGVSLYKQIQDTSYEEWNHLFSVNVGGAFLCSREAAKRMLSEGKGCIVFVSSVWGLKGGSCESAYASSKAALLGLTHALAAELGYSGIRVNAIAPGVVDTDMMAHFSKEERLSIAEDIPVGRFANTNEIASAVCFLVENEYCNGTVLSVDGGF